MNRVESTTDRVRVRTALISVSNKEGLHYLVSGLMQVPDLTILSTGGTREKIMDLVSESDRSRIRSISSYTGQPEMQGGLVKTLDYKVYLGLLSEPFNKQHAEDRERTGAQLIDLVVVNLYPFQEVVSRSADLEAARSHIDIGGPCMLRAAAKSFLRVAAVCDPADYHALIDELRSSSGCVSLATRFRLAKTAFAHTAKYDAAISEYLLSQETSAPGTVYRIRDMND